jgi:L-rhamnose mutarotase
MSEDKISEAMKKIKKEEYTKLNKALYDLEDILSRMGVREFSLSREKHNLQIDTDAEEIDTDLLYAFCNNIAQIHDAAFGHKFVTK